MSPPALRLVSWNIENLAPWLAQDGPELARAIEELGRPDVLCLQEIRVRPQDTELVERMRTAVPGYECHHALCCDPRNVTYRGGRAYGVATYVRAPLAPDRAELPPWDREGRVVVTRLPSLALSIVNLYAVNGTAKPYHDHELGRLSGDRHAFKRRMQDRLFELARDLGRAGGVVMAGDWNVSRAAIDTHPRLRTEEPHARARAELNRHLEEAEMVDVYRHRGPLERGYTWFNRSRVTRDAARVDYILVSAGLVPAVSEAAIVTAPVGSRSDHVPITLVLDLKKTA